MRDVNSGDSCRKEILLLRTTTVVKRPILLVPGIGLYIYTEKNMDYKSEITFRCGEFNITRKMILSFSESLLNIASILYSSLVEGDLDTFYFRFRFDGDYYITRRDEQDTLFGYSHSKYYILDDECFQNAIKRGGNTAVFELVTPRRQAEIVFDMEIGGISGGDQKEKSSLLGGEGILLADTLTAREASFDEIKELCDRQYPIVKKFHRYQRPR